VFRRRRFFDGLPVRIRGSERLPDISWFAPDGSEMSDEDWDSGFGKSVAVYLNGHGIPDLDSRGQRVTDDSFVMCFNAHHEPIDFTLPPREFGAAWQPVIYTVDGAVMEGSRPVAAEANLTVEARSVIVLQAAAEKAPE
jgi:glycogen operon protein